VDKLRPPPGTSRRRREDSGTFGRHPPTEGSAFEPETIVVALAWILSLVQIALGVMRGGAFGPDRAIAVAFAVGCPLLARHRLVDLARRAVARLRPPIGRPSS
jgi:hypothetical protein